MINFKSWLESAEYPRITELPQNIEKPIKAWFASKFAHIIYEEVLNEINEFREKDVSLQKNSFKKPEIDIHKIKSDASWDKYIGAIDDVDAEVERQIKNASGKNRDKYINNHKIYNSMLDLIRYLRKSGYLDNKDEDNYKSIPIDLSGWKYLNLLKTKIKDKRRYRYLTEPLTITTNLYQDSAAAAYTQINNTIAIRIGHFANLHFKDRLMQLNSTIEHELIHWMQKKILYPLGLAKDDEPGEYQVPGWDYAMDDDDAYEKEDKYYLASKTEIPAQFRNALGEFASGLYSYKSDQSLDERIKEFLDYNKFFNVLKKYKPDAWKRMVGLFYREVKKLPQLKKINAGSSSYYPLDSMK